MIQIPCKIFLWCKIPFKVLIPIQDDKVILKYNLSKLHVVHYEYELTYMGELLKSIKKDIEDEYIDGYAYLDKENIITIFYRDKEDLYKPKMFLPDWVITTELGKEDLENLKITAKKLYSGGLTLEYLKYQRSRNGNNKL